MVKRILLTLLQFLVFGALLVVGAFWALVRLLWPPIAFIPVWHYQISATHDFIANGLIFALAFLVFLLLIQALRKTLKSSGVFTTLAFLVAVALSLIMKLGLLTIDR